MGVTSRPSTAHKTVQRKASESPRCRNQNGRSRYPWLRLLRLSRRAGPVPKDLHPAGGRELVQTKGKCNARRVIVARPPLLAKRAGQNRRNAQAKVWDLHLGNAHLHHPTERRCALVVTVSSDVHFKDEAHLQLAVYPNP